MGEQITDRTKSAPASDNRARRGQRIGTLIARIAGPALKKRGLTRAELLVDWPQVVGTHFARHLMPLKLTYPRGRGDAGILHLAVAPGLATAVQHDAPRLIERINTYVGYRAVGQLRLTTGLPAAPPPRPPVALPPRRATPPPAVAALADGPLKDALRRLAAHVGAPSGSTHESARPPITRL